MWANLASDGQFFPDIIKALVDNGKVRPDTIEGVDTVFLKQILKGAEVAASRGLGHEADSVALSLLDALSRYIGTNVSQARKKGYGLDKAIGVQTAFGIANRYAYGGLRWLWLTIEKTSGLALLQTVITDLATPGIKHGLKTGDWGRLFNQYASRPIDINDGNPLQTDNDKAKRINQKKFDIMNDYKKKEGADVQKNSTEMIKGMPSTVPMDQGQFNKMEKMTNEMNKKYKPEQ